MMKNKTAALKYLMANGGFVLPGGSNPLPAAHGENTSVIKIIRADLAGNVEWIL